MNIKKPQGFTMIELVIVIVIVGILAAVALPRFSNLKNQARISANKAFAGALQAAVNIAHTAWIAAGAPSTSSLITLEGNVLTMNSLGWRDYGMGIVASVPACTNQLIKMLANYPQVVTNGASCTESPCYVTSVATSVCTYTLQNGTNGNAMPLHTVTYDLATGIVTAT